MWDYVFIVRTSIEDWKTTPWLEINVEQMEMDCKKFAKDIRTLDKEMRAWDTYVGVEGTVKNMITSLRAVSELQNPAIRDRHWHQLMQATGVSVEVVLMHINYTTASRIHESIGYITFNYYQFLNLYPKFLYFLSCLSYC